MSARESILGVSAEALEQIIGMVLGVAAGTTERDRRALDRICANAALTRRACTAILNGMLRAMAYDREPRSELRRTIEAVVDISKQH